MAVPDQFTDLVKLNAYIGVFLDRQSDKRDKSRGLPGGFEIYPGLEDTAETHFERISTGSGGVNDCLIYAFLQATCPNFRCLTSDNQKGFASNYRRQILIRIAPNTGVYSRKRETDTDASFRDRQRGILARINSTGFLQDIEISILCEYYHIKILVFEVLANASGNVSQSLVVYGGVEGENRDDDLVYMIYNPGNFHFETVRTPDSYTIPFHLAETLRLVYQPQQDGANMCKYNVGDEVDYEGTRYYIVYRRLGDQGVCREYGLTREKGMALELKEQADLGTPAGAQFVSDNEMAYAEISVPAAEIERVRAPLAGPPARVAEPATFLKNAFSSRAARTPARVADPAAVTKGAIPVFTPEMAARLAELQAKKAAWEAYTKGARGGTRKKSRKRRA